MDSLIDQILQADTGESLWIPCNSQRQALSLKVKCWRKLKKYQEVTGEDPHITISIRSQDKETFIVLTKESFSSKAFLLTNQGEKKSLTQATTAPDRERMIRMMYEDSISHEEILDYFKDLNEDETALIGELFKEGS